MQPWPLRLLRLCSVDGSSTTGGQYLLTQQLLSFSATLGAALEAADESANGAALGLFSPTLVAKALAAVNALVEKSAVAVEEAAPAIAAAGGVTEAEEAAAAEEEAAAAAEQLAAVKAAEEGFTAAVEEAAEEKEATAEAAEKINWQDDYRIHSIKNELQRLRQSD
jgi:hypothetical protein